MALRLSSQNMGLVMALSSPFRISSRLTIASIGKNNRVATSRNAGLPVARTTGWLQPTPFCHSQNACFCSATDRETKNENDDDDDEPRKETSAVVQDHDDDDDDAVKVRVNAQELQNKIPGTAGGGRKLAIVFTCTVCNTRSAKQFSESAYTSGVVIVQCPGCQNRHLIADRLGYFTEKDDKSFDLDTIAAKTGQSVKKITASSQNDGVLEINLQDLVGPEKMQELTAKNTDEQKGVEGSK